MKAEYIVVLLLLQIISLGLFMYVFSGPILEKHINIRSKYKIFSRIIIYTSILLVIMYLNSFIGYSEAIFLFFIEFYTFIGLDLRSETISNNLSK